MFRVTLTESRTHPTESFPCVMKDDHGNVILASGMENGRRLRGTVLKSDIDGWTIGSYSKDWSREAFYRVYGTVRIDFI